MDIYTQYALLQKEIDERVEKQKALRATLEQILPEDGYKDESITVTWALKPKWSYTATIQKLEQAVKLAKKEEEKSGAAEKEIQKTLTIRVK